MPPEIFKIRFIISLPRCSANVKLTFGEKSFAVGFGGFRNNMRIHCDKQDKRSIRSHQKGLNCIQDAQSSFRIARVEGVNHANQSALLARERVEAFHHIA